MPKKQSAVDRTPKYDEGVWNMKHREDSKYII